MEKKKPNASKLMNISNTRLHWQRLPDLGWGFIVAWGISTVFTSTFTEDGAANLGWFWLASMVGAPSGLLAFFFVKSGISSTRAADVGMLAALAGMVFGTALLELSLWIDPVQVVSVQVVAGLVSSWGTAVFTVLWGSYYAKLDMQRIERMAAYSLVLAFCCYALVLVLPALLAAGAVACLPFLSALCFKTASGSETEGAAENREVCGLGDLNVAGFTRLGLGIVGATTVVSLFWGLVNTGAIPLEQGFFEVSVLSGLVVAVLLMAYMARYSRSLNLGTLYRWILPLIAIAFSLLVFSGDIFAMVSTLLVFAVQALLNLLTFVYFAELSKRTGALPVRVFGLGRFFVEFGFLVGILITPFALSLVEYFGSYQVVLFMALTGFIILVMGSIAIQDRLAFSLDETVALPSDQGGADGSQDHAGMAFGCATGKAACQKDAFEMACDRAALEYRLTKREREILSYLAQGYSLPYIRNELYVSQSTIDTHVSHIYKKMDIHSKEDLITYIRNGACSEASG